MKQILFVVALISLLAVSCSKTELKREVPTSPKESYEELPR